MLKGNMLVHAMAGLLGLNNPVEIRMTTSPRGFPMRAQDGDLNCETVGPVSAYWCGYRRKGKIYKHVIFINLEIVVTSDYDLAMVIGHELCHACQAENGGIDESNQHNETFQKLCIYLKTELQKMGFDIPDMYNPVVDTD